MAVFHAVAISWAIACTLANLGAVSKANTRALRVVLAVCQLPATVHLALALAVTGEKRADYFGLEMVLTCLSLPGMPLAVMTSANGGRASVSRALVHAVFQAIVLGSGMLAVARF